VILLVLHDSLALLLAPKTMNGYQATSFGATSFGGRIMFKLPKFGWRLSSSVSATAQQETATSPSPPLVKGNIARYTSQKGLVQFGVICSETDSEQYLLHNELGHKFTLPKRRVNEVIYGEYDTNDIRAAVKISHRSKEFIGLINKLWIKASSRGTDTPMKETEDSLDSVLYAHEVCEAIHGKVNKMLLYVTEDCMRKWGTLFFHISMTSGGVTYTPLPNEIVLDNLKAHALLEEFRILYPQFANKNDQFQASDSKNDDSLSNAKWIVPEHIVQFLRLRYASSLEELVYRSSPLVKGRIARRPPNQVSVDEGEKLLKLLGLAPTPKNARNVLERIGLWSVHQNIEAEVAGLRRPFSNEASEEAFRLLNQRGNVFDSDADRRVDLTHLVSYAIDSEFASEIDDAISIESLENGRERVWIHIADVGRWISPNSELAREAKERTSTVHMPDLRVPMLPESLSSKLLSLAAPSETSVSALSCGVELDASGEIASYQLCMSKIKPAKRLTYHKVDNLLQTASRSAVFSNVSSSTESPEANSAAGAEQKQPCHECEPQLLHDIARLNTLAQSRFAYRQRLGAVDGFLRDKTDLSISAKMEGLPPAETWSLSGYFTWANRSSVALVTEYMFMMSHCAGLFAVNHSIPVIFRTQKDALPSDALNLQPNETPFLRTHRLLPLMNQTRDSIAPGHHLSSGSHNYVSCTSPIRRYQDLYNHYLLKHALRWLHHHHASSTTRMLSPNVSIPFNSNDWKDLDPMNRTVATKARLIRQVRIMLHPSSFIDLTWGRGIILFTFIICFVYNRRWCVETSIGTVFSSQSLCRIHPHR
jgi:hypothetical protein